MTLRESGNEEKVVRRSSKSRRARPDYIGLAGVLLVGVFVVLAVVGPRVAPYSAELPGVARPFAGPSITHWFGADALGRDELSRVLVGARSAVLAAVESVGIAAVAGLVLGLLAGRVAESITDWSIGRAVDFLFAFPEYVLAIIVIVILGPGLFHAAVAIGIVYTPRFARIARTATMGVIVAPYIEAAQLSGRSNGYIIWRHVLPNISGPMFVMMGLSLASAEGAYAALSYLGFGARPPAPDYGSMLASAQPYLTTDPWLAVFPSCALVLLIVGFNLLGDFLRERLSPYQGVTGELL